MFLIGNLIDEKQKDVQRAINHRDSAFIGRLAANQLAAGAGCLEVHWGYHSGDCFPDRFKWLVEAVQKAEPASLCITSLNIDVIQLGLALCPYGTALVNPVTADADRFQAILPLLSAYGAKPVILPMDKNGIPGSAGDRRRVTESIIADLQDYGIKQQDIYVDPLVTPISISSAAGLNVVETVQALKDKYPLLNFACDVENISYGLPNREVINRVYTINLIAAGVNGFFINPLDDALINTIYIQKMLTGQDSFCQQYLAIHRNGLKLRTKGSGADEAI